MSRTPSLANPPVQMMPPGIRFAAELYGILPSHGPDLCYAYIRGPVTPPMAQFPQALHLRVNSHQVSDTSAILIIDSSAIAIISVLTRLIVYPFFRLDLTHHFQLDLTQVF